MPLHITCTNTASAQIQSVSGALAPSQRRGLMMVLGDRGEKVLRQHFRRLDRTKPNANNWPRQHFWARIANATAFDASKTDATKATVTVADTALTAKVNGAVIRPLAGRKNIAIPLLPEVYGKMPRGKPVEGMFFIRAKGKPGGYLVTKDETKGRLVFWYRLLPEVTVPKDSDALPEEGQFSQELVTASLSYLKRKGVKHE